MQFSIIAAAVMATAVSAGSTLYVTDVVTITSCAPTVTYCPAHSTVTSTTSYIKTTDAPSYHNTSMPALPSTHAPAEPSMPVSLSTEYITTCIPTVITKVHTVAPTPTTTKVAPPPTSVKPTGTGVVSPYPTFTGAASHVKGSVYAAGLGLAAFLLA